MTGQTAEPMGAALEPVRTELLRAARADADGLLAEAEAYRARIVANAEARAEAIVDEARRRGREDAADDAASVRRHARRTARADLLATRTELYDELRGRVVAGVRARREEPGYASLVDGMTRRARQLLGPDADITPVPDGGVVATAGGRRVDYSLTAVATRALDGLGGRARELWEP